MKTSFASKYIDSINHYPENRNQEKLFNYNIKSGICLITGAVVSTYLVYSNFNLLKQSATDLLSRTVQQSLVMAKTSLDFLFIHYLEFLLRIPGAQSLLSNVMQLSTILKANRLWKNSSVGDKVFKLFISSAITFKVLQYFIYLIPIFIKACMSKNPKDTFRFLWKCPNRGEASKLSIETLNKIMDSDPWGRFQILNKLPLLFPGLLQRNNKVHYAVLKQMLGLAGYPLDLCDFLSRITPLWRERNNSQNPFLNGAVIWEVLYFLNKHPEIYKDGTEFLHNFLDEIILLEDPISTLNFISNHFTFWKDSDQLNSDKLLTCVVSLQDKGLSEWLSFFKGFYKLSRADIEKFLTLKAFDENTIDYLRKHIINVYASEQKNSYAAQQLKGPVLNIYQFFNSHNIDKANFISNFFGDISPEEWFFMIIELLKTTRIIYREGTDDKIDNLAQFSNLCFETSDAKSSRIGAQIIVNRVKNVVTHLLDLRQKLSNRDLDQKDGEQIIEKIKTIIDILAKGGTACPDKAIVALVSAENHINLFRNPKNVPHVLANMFKLNLISATLINQNHKENIETYYYLSLKYNEILNLGIPSGSTMLYEALAHNQSLGEGLYKLVTELTAENLIGYAANLNEFKMLYADEYGKKSEAIKYYMNEVCGIGSMNLTERQDIIQQMASLGVKLESNQIEQIINSPKEVDAMQLMRVLNDRRERIENNFYEEKSTELFLNSGFLISQPQIE